MSACISIFDATHILFCYVYRLLRSQSTCEEQFVDCLELFGEEKRLVITDHDQQEEKEAIPTPVYFTPMYGCQLEAWQGSTRLVIESNSNSSFRLV